MAGTPRALARVDDLLQVEEMTPDRYCGVLQPTRAGLVFGGQMLGQTVTAAGLSAPNHPWAASLHTYFVRRPAADEPLTLTIDRTRDGRSFAWRRVLGTQDDAVVIDSLACFRRTPLTAAERTRPGTRPEQVPSPDEDIASSALDLTAYYDRLGPKAMDTRYVRGTPKARIHHGDRHPQQEIWMKPYLETRHDPLSVAARIAYMSDMTLLSLPMLAHGIIGDGSDGLASSLDHTLRFHHVPDALDWVYFEQECEMSEADEVEVRGELSADGRVVVATASQRGILVGAREQRT
jgi:acyl-CoA thioesterase-2